MNYEEIIKTYDKTISNVCYKYNGCKTPYEDRKQECLITIFNCMHKFEKVQNIRAFIRQICINTNKSILTKEHLNGLHITEYKEILNNSTNEMIYIPYDSWVDEYRKSRAEYSKNYRKNVIYASKENHDEWIIKNRKWQQAYRQRNKEFINLRNKIYNYKKSKNFKQDVYDELVKQYEEMKEQRKIKRKEISGKL